PIPVATPATQAEGGAEQPRQAKAGAPPGIAAKAAPAGAREKAAREADEKAAAPLAAPPAAAADRLEPASSAEAPARSDAAPQEVKAPRSAAKLSEQAAPIDSAHGILAASPDALRITATALDGEGEPPAILNAGELPLSGAERGLYTIEIAADGVPLEVSRSVPERRKEEASLQKRAEETLRKLRFAPGDRPRRLLLRVE
ncbi:MAG: hypothetical protein ACRD3M_12660, partial [Thermoanaerobaculia bacterium]